MYIIEENRRKYYYARIYHTKSNCYSSSRIMDTSMEGIRAMDCGAEE